MATLVSVYHVEMEFKMIKFSLIFSGFFLILFCPSEFLGQANQAPTFQGVELACTITKLPKNALRINLKLTNNGMTPVYIASNPIQIDGTAGYYVAVDELEPTTVHISSRLFEPLMYSPYTVYTRVELKKLMPNKSLNSSITLTSPLVETIPPTDVPLDNKKVELSAVKLIEMQVAYFPEDQSITDFLKSKPFGWFVIGTEKLYTGKLAGKRLYEVQQFVTNDINL